jgi:hypothetical protein
VQLPVADLQNPAAQHQGVRDGERPLCEMPASVNASIVFARNCATGRERQAMLGRRGLGANRAIVG